MYKVKYLPLALDDLKSIVKYIAYTLDAPRTVEKFLVKFDKEILKIESNPFRCPVYYSPEKLKYEYRVLHIDNYSLFFTIDNKYIEVHRVIHSKRDIVNILKSAEKTP